MKPGLGLMPGVVLFLVVCAVAESILVPFALALFLALLLVGPVEFLMLLPNAKENDTTMAADKLRRVIKDDSGLVLPERFTVVTGSSQYIDGDDMESLVERARKAP